MGAPAVMLAGIAVLAGTAVLLAAVAVAIALRQRTPAWLPVVALVVALIGVVVGLVGMTDPVVEVAAGGLYTVSVFGSMIALFDHLSRNDEQGS